MNIECKFDTIDTRRTLIPERRNGTYKQNSLSRSKTLNLAVSDRCNNLKNDTL